MLVKGRQNRSLRLLITIFGLMILYIIGSTAGFAQNVSYDNQAVDLVLSKDGNRLDIIMEFNVESGYDVDIKDVGAINIGTLTSADAGLTSGNFVSQGKRLTIQIDDSYLISELFNPDIPEHMIVFPENSIGDTNNNLNSDDIIISFTTPAKANDFFLLTDNSDLKADITYTTAAGTQVLTIFNKADFESEYDDLNDAMGLIPRDLFEGKLTMTGDDLRALNSKSTSISSLSMHTDLGTPSLDKPYTVVLTTSTPAGSGHNKGANLSSIMVDEGVVIDDHSNRPELTSPKNLISYYLDTLDEDGYQLYLVINFDEPISNNMFNFYGDDSLPFGIDIKFPYINNTYTNIAHSDMQFDADIIDDRLIVKMKPGFFQPNGNFSMRIPPGTIKNASGRANSNSLLIVDNFTMNDENFKHHQIIPGSVDLSIGGSSTNVELQTEGAGRVYNAYTLGSQMTTNKIPAYNTVLSKASHDADNELLTADTVEYLDCTDNPVSTNLKNLSPETDYWWITSVATANHDFDNGIMEGHIYKFTTGQTASLTDLSYDIGVTSDVDNDDFLILTFSDSLMNHGGPNDYRISLDYDADGSMDTVLNTSDYMIGMGQLPPNQLRIDFINLENLLSNRFGVQLKLEIINTSALTPTISNTNKELTIDIPGRNTDLKSLALYDSTNDLQYTVFNFDPNVNDYLNFPILPTPFSLLTSDGFLIGVPLDSNATTSGDSGGDGSFTLTVSTKKSLLNNTYSMTIAEDKYLLESITVGGNTVTPFYPHKYDYDIALPHGTTELPAITYALDSSNPTGVQVIEESSGNLSTGVILRLKTQNTSNNDIVHTYTLNFSLLPPTEMEVAGLTYHTGSNENVNNDDYAILTFSENYTNFGSNDDYNLWIDYNSDGSLDQRLGAGDYSISQGQLPNNQVRIDFDGQMETYLADIMNARLKVEVAHLTNLEPEVISSKRYKKVHIPNRVATATSVRLTHTSPDLSFDSNTFDPSSTYLNYSLLYSHKELIENSGAIRLVTTDPLATVTTSAFSDYPILATVTAEDGFTKHSYQLGINSNDALLEMIQINGSDIVDFSPYEKNYAIELPHGSPEANVTGTFDSQISSTKTLNYETSGDLNTAYTVKVQVIDPELPSGSAPVIEYSIDVTVLPADEMEMTNLEYNTGQNATVNGDDYAILTFSEPIVNMGSASDYKLWIDYNSDGSLDQRLGAGDYSISQGQLAQNQVRIDFDGQMETYLADIMNAELKVEVANLTALEPELISSKRYKKVHIPNRVATATSIHLNNVQAELNFAPKTFSPNDTQVIYSMLYSHRENIKESGQIIVATVDPNAKVQKSDLSSDQPAVTITAEEGHISHTYNLMMESNNTLLETISINGSELSTFSPYANTYNIELPKGTTIAPEVIGYFDHHINPVHRIQYETSGDLSSLYLVKLQVINPELTTETAIVNEYILNITAPPLPEDPNTADNTPSDNDSQSKDEDENKAKDTQVTNTIQSNSGSLVEAAEKQSPKSKTTPAENVINIVEQVNTPAGARLVLTEMPNTLEELLSLKNQLGTLDDKQKMDADISRLIKETERLITLLNRGSQSQGHIESLAQPLSNYYQQMDTTTRTANQLLVSSVAMGNASIQKAGTINLNWSDVEIEKGRVYLEPTLEQINQAATAASQMENTMEGLLTDNLTQGLENAIISIVTLEIPESLEDATRTGAVLDQQVIDTLANNKVKQVNLNMGPLVFGIDSRFLDAHQNTSFEFNVENQGALSEEEEKDLPEGSSAVGAPVLELSSLQNNKKNDAFKKPISISFELDYFDFTPSDGDIERLYIARWNEDNQTWEPVGGHYDPTTNTLTTNRIHLSKYTVLKSDKNYSNIEDSWAKNEIASLKNKGIIEENSLFNGNENISKEEFACWVSKAYGLDATTLEEDGLTLDTDSDYYNELQTLYSDASALSDTGSSDFDSQTAMTREELAVIIANALDNYDRTIDTDTFELAQYEEDLPTWAVDSVETVVENGVVDQSFFGSADAITKEQAANILYEVYR